MSAPHAAVVVGVDGSADSDRALGWAAMAAAERNAPLHVIYALPRSPYSALISQDDKELRDVAQRVLDDALRSVQDLPVPMTTEVADASAASALIAAGEHALMVVVGSRGHGAVAGLLLGSVSQHVSRHAPCPVVVVSEPADPKSRRIVVGIDDSVTSDKAIGFAFDAASRAKAPLVAVHAWHEAWRGSTDPTFVKLTKEAEQIEVGERLIREALAKWTEKYPDVPVTSEVIPAHPARVLADVSEHAALLVVGSRGRGEFAGLLLGSVSQAVLHHARCAVAVVR